MHQTRAEVTKKIPIPRKGTKYVARASSHLKDSVPIVIAVRDMLNLASTTREVKQMIHQKQLKINGREVKEHHEPIKLFNIFEAGDKYILTVTKNGRFKFEKTKDKDRLCKVINKTAVKGKKIQINLHDGSNILADNKIKTNDSVYLDISGKITKHVEFEKGRNCIIISGKYVGNEGKVEEVKENIAKIKLKDQDLTTSLSKKGVIVI